jgi:hypothetical protein
VPAGRRHPEPQAARSHQGNYRADTDLCEKSARTALKKLTKRGMVARTNARTSKDCFPQDGEFAIIIGESFLTDGSAQQLPKPRRNKQQRIVDYHLAISHVGYACKNLGAEPLTDKLANDQAYKAGYYATPVGQTVNRVESDLFDDARSNSDPKI